MRLALLQNPPPQAPALPGFVVFGIPKLQGSSRSARARGIGPLLFERVQMPPSSGFTNLLDKPVQPSSERTI